MGPIAPGLRFPEIAPYALWIMENSDSHGDTERIVTAVAP
jgi:hypothetical protein